MPIIFCIFMPANVLKKIRSEKVRLRRDRFEKEHAIREYLYTKSKYILCIQWMNTFLYYYLQYKINWNYNLPYQLLVIIELLWRNTCFYFICLVRLVLVLCSDSIFVRSSGAFVLFPSQATLSVISTMVSDGI
jgi:hypothetical protein